MDEQAIDLRGILNVFRRRFRFILTLIALTLILTTTALFVITPTYTATSKLLLDVVGKNLFDPDATAPSTALANALIDTEVEIINSRPVLEKAFTDLGLIDSKEHGVSLSAIEKISLFLGLDQATTPMSQEQRINGVFDEFKKKIRIRRQGFTFIINVATSTQNPKDAADIANAIALSHIALRQEEKVRSSNLAQTLFHERIAATRRLNEVAQQELEAYIPNNLREIIKLNKDPQIPILRDKVDAFTVKSKLNADMIEALNGSVDQIPSEVQKSTLVSEGLKILLHQRQELAAKVHGQSEQEFTAEQKRQLTQMDEELSRLIAQDLSVLRKNQEDDTQRAIAARNELTARVVQIAPASFISKLDALRVRAKVNNDMYTRLVERGTELQVQTDVQISNVSIVELAAAPLEPSFPNKLLVLAIAFVSAAGVAVGLAFVLDQYWGGITSEGQLADVILRRVVAVVPAFRPFTDVNGNKTNLVDVMDNAPSSNFAETIRRIRSEIDLAGAQRNRAVNDDVGRVVLVTSAVPSEGKTTVAISLAKSMAHAGAKVLLIDADFRKPSIHKFLELDGGSGLLEYLQNPDSVGGLTKSFTNKVIPNLDALVGQSQLGLAADSLVSNIGFERLIDSVAKLYDFVVIDTPPLLPVVDTSYLLHLADVAVFVVGFSTTSQQDVRKANMLLEKYLNSSANVVPVLNRSDSIALGYSANYESYFS